MFNESGYEIPKMSKEEADASVKDMGEFVDKISGDMWQTTSRETVKQFIRTIRLKDREELIGEMPKKKVVTRSSVGDYYKYEDWEGFNDAMCQVKKLITEHYN